MDSLLGLAFIFLVLSIGDFIAKKTNARISMIFISGFIFLFAFWFGLPTDIFESSGLIGFAEITILMFMAHLGSSIRINAFLSEWRTVILSSLTTIGLAISVYGSCCVFLDKYYALASAPVLSGGMIAYTIVKDTSPELLREEINAFIALILVLQTFIGLPVASFCCRRVAIRLKSNNEVGYTKTTKIGTRKTVFWEDNRNKFIRKLSNESSFFVLSELAIIGLFSSVFEQCTNVSAMIFALVFGIALNELGFLPENALVKANGYTFVLAGALSNIFVSLSQTSPNQFVNMIVPMCIVFLSGLIGSTLTAIIFARLLKIPIDMSIALSSAAYFGFPGTYLVPTEIATSISNDVEEQQRIKDYLIPKMVLSGIVSMSVVSVVLATIAIRLI